MKRNLNYLFTMALTIPFCLSLYGADLPVVIEAESGTIGSSFKVKMDGTITYVTISPTLGGTKPDSTSRVITYSVTDDVKTIETLSLKVFPNPANNELKLQNNSDIIDVEIINYAGQIVMSKVKIENNSINISSLPGGVYILKATDRDGNFGTVKFIKK